MTSTADIRHGPHYPLGVAMIVFGCVCASFVGLTIRHIEAADGWQILIYRSLGFSAAIAVFMTFRDRGRVIDKFRGIGLNGVALAICLAVNFALYIFALLHTTIASAAFMVSATPILVAVLGWVALGERVTAATWIAIFAAVIGVGLMLGGGILGGTLAGDLIALAAAATYAIAIVMLRGNRQIDFMPAIFLAGVLAAVLGLVLAPGVVINGHDLILATGMGAFQIGVLFILLTLAARYVPAAEVALLVLTEVVLAPFWVWLILGETPPLLSLLGGVIVLCAVAGQAIKGIRDSARYSPGTG